MGIEFNDVGVLLIYLGIAALTIAALVHMYEDSSEEIRDLIPQSAATALFTIWGLIWPIVWLIFIREVWRAARKYKRKK